MANRMKNIIVEGASGRSMATDIFYNLSVPQPVVIYAHGFNGFKDWGNFNLIAEQFANAGFTFIKFNFSHNGTTPESPEDFVDLEAYGHNNYTKELYDLQQIIDWALDPVNPYKEVIDPEQLYLVGHSRGGGIVLLKGVEDTRVKAIATWASVSACKTPWGNWTAEQMTRWEQEGVAYYTNARTKQQMPLYHQLYQDYIQHEKQLDILKAVSQSNKPLLICHGTKDEAVPVSKAYEIHSSAPHAELFIIDSDHVFGRKHPWQENALPTEMQSVVEKTIRFFKGVH